MIVLGLTGSIGMGKTTIAQQFRQLGIQVHEADACVHDLMARDGAAYESLRLLFPECAEKNGINRPKLGSIVFNHQTKRNLLEKVLHPLVQLSEMHFVQAQQRLGMDICVLDIPLLFETNAQARVDKIICVTAPLSVQRRRVLARKGMTQQRFEQILSLQVPDADKKTMADFVVNTARGKAHSLMQLKTIIHELRNAP